MLLVCHITYQRKADTQQRGREESALLEGRGLCVDAGGTVGTEGLRPPSGHGGRGGQHQEEEQRSRKER